MRVNGCETVTWMSHDRKRLNDGEQMLMARRITKDSKTYFLRGLRYTKYFRLLLLRSFVFEQCMIELQRVQMAGKIQFIYAGLHTAGTEYEFV